MNTIPGYSNYLLTEDGRVFSKHQNGYLSGSTNPDGYHNFRLTGDDGYTLTWGRHRLMCFVFKHPGTDIAELVVNHKNGIKGDDFLDNLEWVTQKENVIHAGESGLSEKCVPVSSRDVDTGEILHFPSSVECARYYDTTKDAVLYRIKIGQERVFPERIQYRKKTDAPWYIPADIEKALLLNSTSKCVDLKELKSGKETTFAKLSDLARYLTVSAATITRWMSFPDQPVLPGLIQLKWGHVDSDWRDVGDMYHELSLATGKRPVVAIDDATGTVTIFETPNDCSSVMFIKPSNLCHRLKTSFNTVYPDGFRYGYYSDYKKH